MKKYCYIRFDDVCPTMSLQQFSKAIDLMKKHDIKPLIGIIPANEDQDQFIDKPFEDFWEMIGNLVDEGWSVALHGYNHVFDQQRPKTILCGKKRSEFAGNTLENQIKKISQGKEILLKHGIETDVFFAPAHTYDVNTLLALKTCGYSINCDGASPYSYYQKGILCVPCKNGGVPNKICSGINSVVCHPSEWNDPKKENEFEKLIYFCETHRESIVSFSELRNIKPHWFVTQKTFEKIHLLVEKAKSVINRFLRR